MRTTLRGGDALGDTPWADWGNAAVNESLTATKTVGVWASCLSLRKRWISPPLKTPPQRPSKVCLPAHPHPAESGYGKLSFSCFQAMQSLSII